MRLVFQAAQQIHKKMNQAMIKAFEVKLKDSKDPLVKKALEIKINALKSGKPILK